MKRKPGDPPTLFVPAVTAGAVTVGALIALLLAYG